jgi:predicted acyl esterase
LAAICVWEGAADFYRDVSHHGGIYCTFASKWYGKQVTSVQHGLGTRGPKSRVTDALVCGPETLSDAELEENRCDLGEEFLGHPLADDYFNDRSARWERIDVPILSAANWGGNGLHPRGNFEAYGRANSEQKWLEVHGREHWTEFYTDYGLALQKRFFDFFLKGVDNGWTKRKPVKLQVRHVDRFVERDEDEWPIERTNWTRLHLDAVNMTLKPTVPREPAAIGYDGFGDGATFLLPPSDRTIEITGPLSAKLFISSETVDADLFLVVRAFAPDLREVVFQGALDPHTPIAQGWLRASHRKLDPDLSTPHRPYHSHDERQPLEPGTIYELDIEIWPTCIVLPPGFRLGLTVRGRDYEYPGPAGHLSNIANPMRGCGPFLHDEPRDRPPEIFGKRVTIHTGSDHPSSLLIPVIPAVREYSN